MVDMMNMATIRGTYALTLAGQGGWAPLAGIGVLSFDGAGRVVGAWRESRPGAGYGDRVLTDVVYEAGYGVTGNGMGVLSLPGSGEADGYLAIRNLQPSDGDAIAGELAFMFRSLDAATGSLRTAIGLRLPDGAVFDAASLRGRYVGFAHGLGGQFPVAGFGSVLYDGEGGFSEDNIANVQGDTFRARRFVTGTDRGTYTVNPDGTGTVAGGVLFVITRARLEGDHCVAEEYSFLVPDLVPTNGAQFTGTVKRVAG